MCVMLDLTALGDFMSDKHLSDKAKRGFLQRPLAVFISLLLGFQLFRAIDHFLAAALNEAKPERLDSLPFFIALVAYLLFVRLNQIEDKIKGGINE
jgi:hypothetical protein